MLAKYLLFPGYDYFRFSNAEVLDLFSVCSGVLHFLSVEALHVFLPFLCVNFNLLISAVFIAVNSCNYTKYILLIYLSIRSSMMTNFYDNHRPTSMTD